MRKHLVWIVAAISVFEASGGAAGEPIGRAAGPALTILGSGAVQFAFGGTALAVNPHGNLVYMATGTGLVQFNATNPSALVMTQITPETATGVAVNPATGRIATLQTVPDTPEFLQVFNPDFSVYDMQLFSGCGLTVAGGGGTFGLDTGCDAPSFVLYNENAKTIVLTSPIMSPAQLPAPTLLLNPATGDYYDNDGTTLVYTPSLTISALPGIIALASNPATNRVYAVTVPGSGKTGALEVLDGADNAVLETIATSPTLMAVNTVANRFYAVTAAGIDVYDGATNTKIAGGFTLPSGFVPTNLAMAAGDTRLYVLAAANNAFQLFTLQDAASAVPATSSPYALVLAAALAALGGAWLRTRRPADASQGT